MKEKNESAVLLGRLGGRAKVAKGFAKMPVAKRKAIAKAAVAKRWAAVRAGAETE